MKPVTLSLYNDIKDTLDAVIDRNREAVLTFESSQRAHVWLHRANRYRKALRQHDEIRNSLLPGVGASPYDHLMFSKRENQIFIRLRVAPATIEFSEDQIETEVNPYDK